MPRALPAEIRETRRVIADALDTVNPTTSAAASALASVLLDLCVDLIRRGDQRVGGEMLRMAEKFTVLADATPATVDAVAVYLADHAPELRRRVS